MPAIPSSHRDLLDGDFATLPLRRQLVPGTAGVRLDPAPPRA
jgi:hypothetical protein